MFVPPLLEDAAEGTAGDGPLAASERMVAAVNAAGGNARLTVYPDAMHDSWTETYESPELCKWFLEQAR